MLIILIFALVSSPVAIRDRSTELILLQSFNLLFNVYQLFNLSAHFVLSTSSANFRAVSEFVRSRGVLLGGSRWPCHALSSINFYNSNYSSAWYERQPAKHYPVIVLKHGLPNAHHPNTLKTLPSEPIRDPPKRPSRGPA